MLERLWGAPGVQPGSTHHNNLVLLKWKGQVEPTTTETWTDKYCGMLLRLISVAHESCKSVPFHSLIVQQGTALSM